MLPKAFNDRYMIQVITMSFGAIEQCPLVLLKSF